MRLLITVSDARTGSPSRILLDADGSTPLSEIVPRLAHAVAADVGTNSSMRRMPPASASRPRGVPTCGWAPTRCCPSRRAGWAGGAPERSWMRGPRPSCAS
ncbi:MAG: hypothetical protein HIU88_01145 [Acidobacteria bacterium]|nr:hypothetical protein [Acidobacteriota bacterium]